MGCAASSDTGTEYASLGHHGNNKVHVSKKPKTPTDDQLYGKNNNERRKSSSSSSSSSSSDSDKNKENDRTNDQQNEVVPPPPVILTEREKRQEKEQPPPPQPVPPLEQNDKKDPPPPVEEEKRDPVPPPQDQKVVLERRQSEPAPPQEEQKLEEDEVKPPPSETDNNKQIIPVPNDGSLEQKNDPPPPDPVPEDETPPSDPVPKDETPPSDPVPKDEPPPNDTVQKDEAPPSDPVPQNDSTPRIPPEPCGMTQIIDYNNTDGMQSPEPPDFSVSDYKPTDIGTFERSINFRTSSEEFNNPSRPSPNDGGLYTDHDFSVQTAVPKARGLDWMRPGELPGVDNPALFTDGTTRFDIGQGRFGTCWFLSMVANIADKPRLLRRVIPENSYKIGTPDYDGVFHCRFWRFGRWSDVYIDDKLPAQHGHLYGAQNKEDKNEMWVALLEKAFARMYGSYEEVTGGRTADAFMNLTAGVGETIKFDKMKKSGPELFQRLTNAFQSPTTMVGCVCPSQNDGQHGLVGGHAYSMNGTHKYGNTLLVRLRNPWGRQEWTGPWSDGSSEMAQASSVIPHPNKDDGEFYMDIDNFLKYFEQCTICNITPDFDRDGTADTLNYITTIYGNWRKGKSGGFRNKLQNPAYCVTVNDDGTAGADGSGKVPLVVQIVQKTMDRQDDKIAIRVDLYKVLHEDSNFIVLDELGDKNNMYLIDFSASYRFSVAPGRYVAIPSTMHSSDENPKVLKEFLIRFFSAGPLNDPAEVPDSAKIIAGKGPELDIKGTVKELPMTRCMPGRFVTGCNAGGQISCRDTFASNPQCLLTIREPQTIKVEIMQPDPDDPNAKMPLGIKLFKADGSNFPADYDFLVNNYGNAVQDTSGNDGPFSYGNSVDCGYCLDPGTYILIVHANGPDDQNDFALAVYSERDYDIDTYHLTV